MLTCHCTSLNLLTLLPCAKYIFISFFYIVFFFIRFFLPFLIHTLFLVVFNWNINFLFLGHYIESLYMYLFLCVHFCNYLLTVVDF